MVQSEARAKFKMTYGDLAQLGDAYVSMLQRDLTDLSDFGLNLQTIDDLKQQTLAFQNMHSDDYYKGLVSEATRDRDASRDKLKTLLAELLLRVALVHGESSPEYARYGLKGSEILSENDYCRAATGAIALATEKLAELAPKGLTQTHLDVLNTALQEYNSLIDAKNNAVRVRDEATQTRVNAGNALFDLISDISAIGKRFYISRNEARYNDYVMWDNPGGKAEEPVDDAGV